MQNNTLLTAIEQIRKETPDFFIIDSGVIALKVRNRVDCHIGYCVWAVIQYKRNYLKQLRRQRH